jgi:hypothetical protein
MARCESNHLIARSPDRFISTTRDRELDSAICSSACLLPLYPDRDPNTKVVRGSSLTTLAPVRQVEGDANEDHKDRNDYQQRDSSVTKRNTAATDALGVDCIASSSLR